MSTDLIFPTQVVLAFVTIGLLARWYVAPRLAGLPRESALQPLLVVQAFRYIGLGFLAPALGATLARAEFRGTCRPRDDARRCSRACSHRSASGALAARHPAHMGCERR